MEELGKRSSLSPGGLAGAPPAKTVWRLPVGGHVTPRRVSARFRLQRVWLHFCAGEADQLHSQRAMRRDGATYKR